MNKREGEDDKCMYGGRAVFVLSTTLGDRKSPEGGAMNTGRGGVEVMSWREAGGDSHDEEHGDGCCACIVRRSCASSLALLRRR